MTQAERLNAAHEIALLRFKGFSDANEFAAIIAKHDSLAETSPRREAERKALAWLIKYPIIAGAEMSSLSIEAEIEAEKILATAPEAASAEAKEVGRENQNG